MCVDFCQLLEQVDYVFFIFIPHVLVIIVLIEGLALALSIRQYVFAPIKHIYSVSLPHTHASIDVTRDEF